MSSLPTSSAVLSIDGRVRGEVITEWSMDGVHVTQLAPFAWRDAAGKWWELEPGDTTDGASIPRALWTVVGSPLTGHYRVPAFLHDKAYNTLGLPKADTDAMFREACVYFGCTPEEAEALYLGVHEFGLRAYADDQAAAARALTAQLSGDHGAA